MPTSTFFYIHVYNFLSFSFTNRVEFSLRHKTGIAFYCSLCFDEKVVVCKSFEDGQWGNEEKYGLKLFETGKSFQVIIHTSL